MIVKVMKTRT